MPTKHLRLKEQYIYVALWAIIILLYLLHIMSEHAYEGKTLLTPHDAVRTFRVLAPLFVLFVINNHLLIPRLLFRHRIRQYVISAILITAAIALWQYFDFVSFKMHHPMFLHEQMAHCPPKPMHHPHRSLIPMPYINDLICAGLVIGVNLAISLVGKQISTNMEYQQLQSASVSDQLEHLKAQINPHFYMNMLNNIHGLVDLDPEKAKDMILDMSKLMRYMLYESSLPQISLTKEINFLNDYIKVMKRRNAKTKVRITTSFPNPDEVRNILVPPLLFLAFIENAFKHGIDYRQESFISIKLTLADNQIIFGCLNSIPQTPDRKKSKSGIGLENIKKRLSILYADKASLNISETTDKYSVSLTIPLNETKDNNN